MIFTSTRNNKIEVSFSRAVKDCLPEDGGVFVPAQNTFEDLRRWIYYINESTSFTSIAGTLTSAFMKDEFSPIICQTIAEMAFPFSPVITQLDENLFNLELYHGYTGCYRDFGVSYLCSYLETTHELNGGNSVFVDFTHGELGTLLAKVLRGKKHIKAVLVYEKGSVRGLENEDYIWNGGNILPLEMEGTEAQIKSAIASLFNDKDFVAKYNLTLANTTNVCRLMAQVFHFPYAFAQIKNKVDGDIFYSMEAGNYGMLAAGLYGWRFALPVNGFYVPATPALGVDAAGNAQILDSFVSLKKRCGVDPVFPANIERLETFFGSNSLMIRNFVFPQTVNERQREKAAKELFIKYGFFADPGTASAYAAAKESSDFNEGGEADSALVLVSQNHPSLSSHYCRLVVGETPVMPENIAATIKPVRLNREVIKNADELKKVIQSALQ
ncbi:MAG: threonine synthase [Treponema sp.]|nr:threonine synthase [Treponema sp.]